MRFRVLERSPRESPGQVPAPAFEGIRKQDKLRALLMADLVTYCTYQRFALQFFSKDNGDPGKYRDHIRSVSKTMVMRYTGFVSGTPADQVNKRIDNLIAAMEGRPPEHPSLPASAVSGGNLAFYRDTFNPNSDGPQISVKVSLPVGSCVEDIRGSSGYATEGRHLALGDVFRWIISRYLEPARYDPRMQSLMKMQYDLCQDLFSDKQYVSEDMGIDLVRDYMALSCILDSQFENVGDEYEPRLEPSSFGRFLLRPPVPELSGNLLVVSEGEVPEGFLGDLFGNVSVISSPISALDLELDVYKVRLAFGFGKYNLLVVGEGGFGIPSALSEICERISWHPVHTLYVGCGSSGKDSHSMSGEHPLDGVEGYYRTGMDRSDPMVLSLVHSAYRDILSTGYPGIEGLFGKDRDAVTVLGDVRRYLSEHEMDPGSEYPELVHSLSLLLESFVGE